MVQSINYDILGSNMIIKLDMEKVDDRLEWKFIFSVLKHMDSMIYG